MVADAAPVNDLVKLLPVDLAEAIMTALFIKTQVGIRHRHAQHLHLRHRVVDKALAKFVIAEAFDFPGQAAGAVRRVVVVRPEHHQRRPPEAVDGVLQHLALSLAACGGKADSAASSTASSSALGSASDYDYQNFNYSDGLDEKGYWEGIRALDYVTLPEDFASVAIKRSDVEPTSEEVEEQISDLLSQYSSTEHITDRAAADGDTVNINYVGSVNNVEFTGGSAENYDLTLGSGTFIDGFEDQIIGHKPGETFDVNVTFPDGYSDSTDANGNTVTLSGQKAVFTVVLNYISESVLPELTDSWVASTFGTSNNIYTVEALRAYYQDQLYTSNLNTAVMDDLLENSTFKSIPQQVMDYQVNQCLNYYSTLAGYYGYDLDGLVQNLLGYENTDAMLAHLESNLEDYSKEALLYQAVAESLDITPTQEQLDAYSDYKDTYGQNYCTMVALMDAVTDTLTSGAVVS